VSSTTAMADVAGSTEVISTWKIDPAHSAAEFKVRHMMISYACRLETK
jgi:polyisoprenoid-binding protein YceI